MSRGLWRILVALLVLAGGTVLLWRHRSAATAGPPNLLPDLSVQAFVRDGEGLDCLTACSTLWSLGATGASPRALTHFHSDVVGAPVRLGNLLIVSMASGAVSAWDLASGARAWYRLMPAPPTSGPAGRGDTVLVSTWPDEVAGLDAQTGLTKWKLALGSGLCTAPLWCGDRWALLNHDGVVVFAAEDGTPMGKIRAGPVLAAGAEGGELWLALASGRVETWAEGQVVHGPRLETPAGALRAGHGEALLAGAGGEVLCLSDERGRGADSGAAAEAGDAGSAGEAASVLWRRRLGAPVTALAGPLDAGGRSLWAVGTNPGKVWLLDARTGATAETRSVGSAPITALRADGSYLAVGSCRGAWLCRLP